MFYYFSIVSQLSAAKYLQKPTSEEGTFILLHSFRGLVTSVVCWLSCFGAYGETGHHGRECV